MLMEVISTYGEFILHLSVTCTANICQRWENETFTETLDECSLRRRALPLGVAARHSLRGEQSIRKHLFKSPLYPKIASINRPTYFLLSTSTEITHFKSERWRASSHLNHIFLYCAKALLWFKIITCLRWEEQPLCVAMLICTCSHGDTRDMHTPLSWKQDELFSFRENTMVLMNISKLVLCHKEPQTWRWHADSSIHLMNAGGFVPLTEGD